LDLIKMYQQKTLETKEPHSLVELIEGMKKPVKP
jgi:hypothetical protein